MTDYKKIADAMQAMPTDRRILSKEDFDTVMKKRKLSFIQNIDTVNNTKREVWGNKNFEIIVLHENDKYQIL